MDYWATSPVHWVDYWATNWGGVHCYFELYVIFTIIWEHFLWAGQGRKCHVCHWNFDVVCHSASDISISGLGSSIAIVVVGRSVVTIIVDTFVELTVVENKDIVTWIIVILIKLLLATARAASCNGPVQCPPVQSVCLMSVCRQNTKTRFSQKLCNLEPWSLLTTYRKSYMGFLKNPLLDP